MAQRANKRSSACASRSLKWSWKGSRRISRCIVIQCSTQNLLKAVPAFITLKTGLPRSRGGPRKRVHAKLYSFVLTCCHSLEHSMKTINRMNRIALAALLAAAAGLQGCMPSTSADVYTAQQAQREQSVRMGTVESIRPVKIQANGGKPSGVGTVGGALAGGVAGSTIGGGRGSTLAALGGRNGVEITVRLDDGTLRAVTQEVTKEVFRVGERVRLLTANGVTRVTH